jgi:tetratricopeptide (TPR) repeat protein
MNTKDSDKSGKSPSGPWLSYLETGRRQASSGIDEPAVPSAECSSAADYLRVATGQVEKGKAEQLLAHATNCAGCCELLAGSLRALEGSPSPEEAAAIEELAAARTGWQKNLARRLASTPARPRPGSIHFLSRRSFRRAVILGGGISAIAATLLAAAFLYVWQRQRTTPEHLLALAYVQSRTLELRIPQASYAGLATGGRTRTPGGPDQEPPALLDARAKLARELARSPQNAHWQQLQARAYILEQHYDRATDILDRLLAAGPVTSDLLVDAASAYFQRGSLSGSASDRATALDYLRRADELAPTDPVVLFNEAIVMQDRNQIMNAVEVWNRYLTVEHDAGWVAEGKRKLLALEQSLNQLRSHQTRVDRMLSSPQAMDALAANPKLLATLDEELSTLQLHRLVDQAFPLNTLPGDQSRGSPAFRDPPACSPSCSAARNLLKAIGASLEVQHHDSWLTDLLPPSFDSLPPSESQAFSQAIGHLGDAADKDYAEQFVPAETYAANSRAQFIQLSRNRGPLEKAARVGAIRASTELLFARQRNVDFRGCRSFAAGMHSDPSTSALLARYPWIQAQTEITEKICDDTPDARASGRALELSALKLAQSAHYPLLAARIQLMRAGDAELAGDSEEAERIGLETIAQLFTEDAPPYRIANTFSEIGYVEQDTPRTRYAESFLRESLHWNELAGLHPDTYGARMFLARADLRLGKIEEEQRELGHAQAEARKFLTGGSSVLIKDSTRVFMAESLLERGDLAQASNLLGSLSPALLRSSDAELLRTVTATQSQLDLAEGHYDRAAVSLEVEIRRSEGQLSRQKSQVSVAEFALRERDIYAELAAVWLAQGRSPAAILALWERFRLRMLGLPIRSCPHQALDCEESNLVAAQQNLGDNVLIGQILLMDRVLIYKMDRDAISWSQKRLRRQEVLDSARDLEVAVSSPATTLETASLLGSRLSEVLLPTLPARLNAAGSLLIEPDPSLADLSWPVLPSAFGPLGLQYPITELRSMLSYSPQPHPLDSSASLPRASCAHALVIGASVAGKDDIPLPEVLEEARAVSHFLNHPRLLLGEDASRRKVEISLQSASVLHFAGHAARSIDGTELLLAADPSDSGKNWVDGATLRQFPPLACRLAVLSACSSGRRDSSWNRPLHDLVETLHILGVPDVVATRWPIDSEAAVPFMEAFYENLSLTSNIPLALNSARRLLFQQSRYNNPYYWGAYYSTGNGVSDLKGVIHGRG